MPVWPPGTSSAGTTPGPASTATSGTSSSDSAADAAGTWLRSQLGSSLSTTGDPGARSKYFRTTAAAQWKRNVMVQLHEAAVVMDRQALVVIAAEAVDAWAQRMRLGQEPELLALRQALVALGAPRRRREDH